ncbi:MAG: hypothetical protein Ta2B_06210 [Termitinemataceae bacterium]|nr:MAG: hypothetical protein Ta2B_06210 [Termitinemataceae bacterium]
MAAKYLFRKVKCELQLKNLKISALFLSSIAGISYELFVMRIFSIGGWSAFGSLVISAALLGVGLSGIIVTLFASTVERHSEKILSISAIILPLLMSSAVIVSQLVPFNPVYLSSDKKQMLYIGLYYIIYGVPFFVSAAFTGVMFFALRNQIQKLYFWNMIGSGVGGFFIILFMFVLPPQFLILPILAVTILAAMLASFSENAESGKAEISVKRLGALVVSAALSIIMIFMWGGIHISESKDMSYVRKYPDSKLVHHSYAPGGEYHVYYSKYFHFAPGLSDNAALKIPLMPVQPYWGMYIDGSGPIGVMGYLRETEKPYMDYLPMAAPYNLLDEPKTLLINLSGGINTQIARYKKASQIDILEPSSEIINILKYDQNITRFNGGLLAEKNIKVVKNEGRTWCKNHKNNYDLIEISLVDSIGLTDSGGYPVHEDYKWTVEAFKEYIAALKNDGILSITVWDKLNPPRNVLKLVNTISRAMRELNIYSSVDNVYSFGLFMSTTTILVKKSAWNEEEISTLNKFVDRCSFERFYVPNETLSENNVNSIIKSFKYQFTGIKNDGENYSGADLYKAALPVLLSGNAKNIEDNYVFDIRPITDSRPYYSGYLKFNMLNTYLKHIESISEEWGYLLLLGMLLQAIIFGAIVIVIPLLIGRKNLFDNGESKLKILGVIIYYASLGLGYMLIEIYLIQRFALYLANPIYSTSIVITAMLIFSALGNMASTKLKEHRTLAVLGATILIVVVLLFYIFGLNSLIAATASYSFFVHAVISVLVIGASAFFMGVPYPNGLDSLQENSPALLPWAWGMNGGLSVAGSALARVISVSSGFNLLLWMGIALYLAVGVLFKVNTMGKAQR